MLVYRVGLEPGAQTVLAASLRSVGVLPGGGMSRLRATVRYLVAGGAVRTHRGWMAAAVPEGATPVLTAWQLEGDGALLTFRMRPPVRPAERGLALTDRFHLPLGLEAWGVIAVNGVRISVTATCKASGQALRLRGAVTVSLSTVAAEYPIRIPFCRTVAVPAGLEWAAHGGVTALRLRVDEGGRISGEMVLTYRYEGRPPAAAAGGPTPAEVRLVRELTGRVLQVEAEHAGHGQAVVRGAVELEFWWLDREGRSRMTSRTVCFSSLLEIPGAGEHDRLEACARLERLAPVERQGALEAQGALSVTVTALRDVTVLLGDSPYRLPQAVGAGTGTVLLTEPLTFPPEPSLPVKPGTVLLLPQPPEGWQQALALEAPGFMTIEAVSEAGVQVRRIPEGAPQPERRLRAGDPTELILRLPGPVRRVVNVQAWPLAALVQLERGMHLVTATTRLSRKADALLAYPVVHGAEWQLRVWVT